MNKILVAGAALALSAFGAQAATYTNGATESDSAVSIAEMTNVAVGGGDVIVDYLVGTNLSVGDTIGGVTQFSSGEVLGTGSYDSYLIHFDPIGNSGGSDSGSFTFAEDIVALIVSNGAGAGNTPDGSTPQLLVASDAVFGLAGDSFEQNLGRRSEDQDTFELLTSNTLGFDFTTGGVFIDNVRVITQAAAVPLPAAGFLLLGGLGLLGAAKRRKSQAAA